MKDVSKLMDSFFDPTNHSELILLMDHPDEVVREFGFGVCSEIGMPSEVFTDLAAKWLPVSSVNVRLDGLEILAEGTAQGFSVHQFYLIPQLMEDHNAAVRVKSMLMLRGGNQDELVTARSRFQKTGHKCHSDGIYLIQSQLRPLNELGKNINVNSPLARKYLAIYVCKHLFPLNQNMSLLEVVRKKDKPMKLNNVFFDVEYIQDMARDFDDKDLIEFLNFIVPN